MHIVFPIFDQVTQLDFTGPVQVLSRVPNSHVHVVSGTLAPVATDSGFSILPNTTFARCPQADVICIPGGPGTAAACQDQDLLQFLEEQVTKAQWITSVCTGMFVLGKLGLLENRRVTSHWGYTELIAELGAKHEKARFVVDENIVTGGGVTAGIDFALFLTSLIAGEETAKGIQLALEYDPHPPFDTGHPDRAPRELIENLLPRYQAATEQVRAVLK